MSDFSFRAKKTGKKPDPNYTPKPDYIPHGCRTPEYCKTTPPAEPKPAKRFLKVCSVSNESPSEYDMAWKIQDSMREMKDDIGAENFKLISVFPEIKHGQIDHYIAFYTCEITLGEGTST